MKRILYVILALFICQSVSAQLPTANLEAWYPFCNDTTDHNLIGYDLFNSNIQDTTDRFGIPKMAKYFNGTNGEMHYSTFFAMTLTSPFSYTAWFYPVAPQNSIIFYNGDPAASGMGIMMDDGAGGAGQKVSIFVGGVGDVLSSGSLSLFQWHHVALVRSGNAYILYVDNAYVNAYLPVTTPSFPGFFLPTTPPGSFFQVGSNHVANSSFFNGFIDDVSVWSRLLTNTDVNKIHNFNPDIVIGLGPDTSICANAITLPLNTSLLTQYPYPTYHWRYDTLIGTSILSLLDSASSPFTETATDTPSVGGTKIILKVTRPLASMPYDNSGNSCVGRDTIVIKHVRVKIDLGNDTTFCLGNSITLNNPPTPGERFHWSLPITTDTMHVNSSGTYYVNVDSVYYINPSDSVICHGTDTIVVHVPDSIRVHLGPHLNYDTTLCQGLIDTLYLYSKDSATYGSPHYLWGGPPNVGGSTTSVTTPTVTGVYWLQVNDSSCIASDTIRVKIVFDTVHVYNVDTAICRGQHIVTVASFNPILSYQWTPTAGMPSSSNPATTITPDTSAWYVLTASIVDSTGAKRCSASDSFFLDVQPNPYVYAGGNRFVCVHDSIRITPHVEPDWYTHYVYDWSPGNYLNDSLSPIVVFTPGDTTKLFLVVKTPAGCSGIDSAMIFTYEGDFASMGSYINVCPGDTVRLSPVSTQGPTTYVWHPATYLDDSTSSTPLVQAIVSEDYIGVATSQYGCKDTVHLHVKVNPAGVITMEDSVQIEPGTSYQIKPVTNIVNFSWSPPLYLSDTGVINPVATPQVNTMYILTGRTEFNCLVQDSIKIRIDKPPYVKVPNAFAPGTDYGALKVYVSDLARLRKFNVYNRWGNMVFTTTDASQGWDGTYNGKPEPLGVYIYEIEAVTTLGTVVKERGNVTLLR